MTDKSSFSVRDKISQSLDSQILLLDGAMGTMIQGHDLQEKDYRFQAFTNSTWKQAQILLRPIPLTLMHHRCQITAWKSWSMS